MALQVDALQSFTHLTSNIPVWLTKLDDLVTKCEIQYERFTRITQYGEVKLTRKKKHGSTESLRPGRDATTTATLQNNREGPLVAPPLATVTSAPSEIPNASHNIQAQEIPRKRRAGSELSGAGSNHCRYRTKSMVVVYYDSEIQEIFESLVKNIASARNSLRKGKNTASFKSRMASMGLGSSAMEKTNARTEGLALDPKMMLANAKLGRQSGGNEMKCFEDADKNLEDAQNLCERAAHQFLRDGDCQTEIEGTRERFVNCEDIARQEVERLSRAQQVERAGEREDEEQEEERTLIGEKTPPIDRMEEKPIEIDVIAKMTAPPLKQVNFAGTGAIEIDDCSDEESVHIDLSAIRRTVRSTRA